MSVKQLFDLTGRVAVVTGGSRGLGLQMAEALGEMGARVAITARKIDELESAVAHLKGLGIAASAYPCDLGKREQIEPLAAAIVAKFAKVDILVNNAGAVWGAPAEDHPLDAWDKLVNLNLSANFVLSKLIAKQSMIPQKWGRIVNLASVSGLQGTDARLLNNVSYVATKHGVIGLTRQLAAEWGRHGITVNAICPGFFPSKMTRATLDASGEFLRAATPAGRLGGEEDLKGLVVLLASQASAHITGQAIAVDGGRLGHMSQAERNIEFAREFQKKIPFVGHLGIEVDTIGDGEATLSIELKPELTNSFGSAHGGVILSLMDVALCTAARSQHSDSIGVITVDLSLQFIGVGRGRLVAQARVLKPGRNTVFTEGEIRSLDGSLVAKAIGTVRVRVADK